MMVAWFLLSCFVLPLHMGYPYHCFFSLFMHINIFSEIQVLAMDTKKHRSVSSFVEWLIFFSFVFLYMPRWVLTKTALINSGYTKQEHPLLHKILFDWHTMILICSCIVGLVWFCVNLSRGALRYQFSRLGQAVIAGFLCALSSTSLQAFMQIGMFWVVAVPITIAANDTWAYLVGRTFGRTPLISLSPNKTLEGFLGGALFTFVMILIFCQTIFQYKRFTCISQRLNPGWFEQILCTNEDSQQVFQN
jgi:phosphatidate cytidylyltransferase